SQQPFNPRRNCIVKLVERWIFLQNARSQEIRVSSHVVVNCGQFRHGSPLVRGGICGRERENKGKEGKDGWRGRLVGRQEEVFETQTRPADRTSFSRKTDGSTLNAPTEPGKKLFLLAFDQHRDTSDTESTDDRLMRFQFAGKPVSPVRHSGDPVDMGERGPNESVFRACQRGSSCPCRYVAGSELFRQPNKVTQRLLASGKLYRAFEALCVAFETYSNRRHTWSFHHEPVSQGDRRADSGDLCVPTDH